MRYARVVTALGLAILVASCEPTSEGALAPETGPIQPLLTAEAQERIGPGVREAIVMNERARVMIAFVGDVSTFGVPSPGDLPELERTVAGVRTQVLAGLQPGDLTIAHQYESIPALAGTLSSEDALIRLASNPFVLRIDLEIGGSGSLATSVPQINADDRHALGNDGEGVVVAVLDSGIDSDHPDLSDDIGQQACFGDNDGTIDGAGFCPNGSDRQTGAGSAEDDHGHGTHVSSIITSNGTTASVGTAPGANIVAVKVLDSNNAFFFSSEVTAGLQWVINNINTLNVQVINMSLGTNALFASPCDNANANTMAMAAAINTLRGLGVTTFVSSGNAGSGTGMGAPACVANAISVGAVDASDVVAVFSNSDAGTDIFAPGTNVENVTGITASRMGGGTVALQGTSMASPHAAGCAALLIDSGEATTPAAIETRLETSSVQVTDATNGLTFPRIDCGPTGTIEIEKTTSPAGRTGFGFTDDIEAPNSFSLDDGQTKTFTDVTAGTYSVTETAASFFATGVTCVDPDGQSSTSGATATIDLDPGETVTCTFTNTDQAPTVSATPTTQTIQYSDQIADITVTAMDSNQDALTGDFTYNFNGGAFAAGLPAGMSVTDNGCTTTGDKQTCTWTISGNANVTAGAYKIRSTVTDDTGDDTSKDVTVNVTPEDASVAFDAGNPVGVQVAAPGGNSGPFSLIMYVTETVPDLAVVGADPGDLSNAVVTASLQPVGPGGAAPGVCVNGAVTGVGYGQVLPVTCSFDNVPVNTYTATVDVNTAGYYVGGGEDVVTVFDPSLGFTTGGGWFYWPGTTDKTNFGYTMKYNKQGTRVQGSLLMIRHLADGTKYRVKSNALGGLAIGSGAGFDWATFTGKSTYLEPGWPDPIGNYSFVVYVEDHGEPGVSDRFWIQVLDKDGVVVGASSMAMPAATNAETLEGGNIVVPHAGGDG